MIKRTCDIGLITLSKCESLRCDRCDLLLKNSKWNDVMIFYSTNKKLIDGFVCIQCAVGYNKQIMPKITVKEVDDFLTHLKKEPVLLA